MLWKRLILTGSILLMSAGLMACGTTSSLRIAQIPLRPELRQCAALEPMPREALPPMAEDAEARRVQILERSAWMQRDLRQSANNRENCNRLGEVVALVDANNAGPSDE